MPAIVQPASSKLGSLLRRIQEEESTSPHKQLPGTDPAAPVRETVEAPLETPIAPESPGSERVISLKPEGSTPLASDNAPSQITPTTSKIGPIGGVNYDPPTAPPAIDGVGQGSSTPAPIPQAPPSYDEFKGRPGNAGKPYSTYLAETGQQNVLDVVRQNPRTTLDESSGRVNEIGDRTYQHNPQAGGGIKFDYVPKPYTPPNNATLQEYLAQGKTAEQWYAETGRQSQLDAQGGVVGSAPGGGPSPQDYLNQGKTLQQWYQETGRQGALDQLTQGGTVGLPATFQQDTINAFDQGVQNNGQLPTRLQDSKQDFIGPTRPGQSPLDNVRVSQLAQTIAPSVPETSEFIGPIGPGQVNLSFDQLRSANAGNVALAETSRNISAIDNYYQALNNALSKPEEQRTEEEKQIVDQSIKQRMAERVSRVAGGPTPTPIPLPTLRPN